MFGVSLLYTMAYAFSITRYKLMQVEEIINRSAVYFAFSLTAGLIYSGVLLVGGKLIGDQLFSTHSTSRGAVVAALSVIVVLILSEVARGRFQRVIDRQFFREKYKLDRAMQKMRLAVGSLIDRATLGRRLLEAAAEVLRLEWGALYLERRRAGRCNWWPATALRPTSERSRRIIPGGPAAADHAVRLSHALALNGLSDPATDAMIALGGEAATSLGDDGQLSGLLVLGPKRSGMPYEDEEMAFLAALSSVATLVLHSADIQQTLESLNHELRDKVEKIAEQQRRILILQDQLRDRAERERDSSGLPSLRPAERARLSGVGEGDFGPFESIKGSSAAVRKMIGMARKVAVTHSAVLIRGESGTGKELLAAAIHQASPRAGRPFVKLHCAALVAEPAGERAVRPRQKCVHRGRPRPRGTIRAGQRRHALPRRDRRHQPRGPDQALARAPGDVVRASRQLAADHGRRPDPGRHPPGPGGLDSGRPVPRRPLLPAQRDLPAHSRPCASAGRTFSSWRSTSSTCMRSAPASWSRTSTPRPSRRWWLTTGPATSASWKTSWSERSCWPTGRP